MNLQNLFETQKRLDAKIVKEKGLEGQDLLDKKILALQVELGELANEWRGFKFWSEDQEPKNKVPTYEDCKNCEGRGYHDIANGIACDDCRVCEGEGMFLKGYKNPLLEEYVDCLHFILSIGNELSIPIDELVIDSDYTDECPVRTFVDCYGLVPIFATIDDDTTSFDFTIDVYEKMLNLFIGLGEKHLGFTWEQIEQAYFDKNKINHERQENGY